jgi:hypothetical protein
MGAEKRRTEPPTRGPVPTSAATQAADTAQSTRPFRRTRCGRDCPDCDGRTTCTRPTQWLRRVGYPQLFRRAA